MIASLRGTVISIGLTDAVIECSGVGYAFLATATTLATLHRGEEAFVLTSMVVREDSMTLYGFSDNEQREMFGVLQSVSGLGPKLALAALSFMSPEDIARAIMDKDAKSLQRIPGVGKRVAERMILELRDKVTGFATAPETASGTAAPQPSFGGAVAEQVVEAITGLGFPAAHAEKAVAAVLEQQPSMSTSETLRAALAFLGKK